MAQHLEDVLFKAVEACDQKKKKMMFHKIRGIFLIQISIWLPYNQDTATASKNTVKSKETPAT